MNYRLGRLEDVEEISKMVDSAKVLMSSQGIEQWDEIYPAKEDFEDDIEKKTLYVVMDDDSNTESGFTESDGDVTETNLAAIYVISTECDDAYENGSWEYDNACIIHRLCVSPDYQNKGIGKKLLNKIEDQLADMGFDSVRLDVFSENPFALRLYENNGYEKRGHADWRKGRFYLMEKKIG
ncbi:Ribosomal protein S18 acetylase RimI [Butyrivibrio proteoclasticus]|uniref:Ribosomal protein S18 acetylase RimI n=1 Tax=Butyrivibrio proteoclasticus TaxID=43305 RepID=A0A1I5WU74_9FIRM|nr:GNAT family N-acetyltransferase [Butyrivibrio proteoclasticus]SFQ23322.1 Ribosomal protein S18 acetylase RimI [Butyrivibrio proteoclasticus]